jgi:hypothetical protein
MDFLKINNRKEWEAFAISLQDEFGCFEDWDYFFEVGICYNKNDEDGFFDRVVSEEEDSDSVVTERYQHQISGPEDQEYPVVVCYLFEKDHDRFGEITKQLLDYNSIDKLPTIETK